MADWKYWAGAAVGFFIVGGFVAGLATQVIGSVSSLAGGLGGGAKSKSGLAMARRYTYAGYGTYDTDR